VKVISRERAGSRAIVLDAGQAGPVICLLFERWGAGWLLLLASRWQWFALGCGVARGPALRRFPPCGRVRRRCAEPSSAS